MADRHERRKRWVQRGEYAVEVEVDVIYPDEDSSEPCLEPATVRWLDEIAQRAEAGNLAYLHNPWVAYSKRSPIDSPRAAGPDGQSGVTRPINSR